MIFDTYNNIKKKFEKELEDNINVYEQKYNEEKNKIELDYDSIILKLHKYNYELKMKYTNIIKLNEIILNRYKKNKSQYFYIINIFNDIKFIKKYNKESQELFYKEINNKYNININEEKIEIKRNIISNEGMKNIISEIKTQKLINLLINSIDINSLNFLEFYNFNSLNSISVINCYINKIDNIKNFKCPQLKKLDLSSNLIKDINTFKNSNLNSLESLNLSNNCITDITVLAEEVFINLKEINLSYNKIEDISILNKTKFKNIKTIVLSYNTIKNIFAFNWNHLLNLTNLFLDNQYESIQNSNFYLIKNF